MIIVPNNAFRIKIPFAVPEIIPSNMHTIRELLPRKNTLHITKFVGKTAWSNTIQAKNLCPVITVQNL